MAKTIKKETKKKVVKKETPIETSKTEPKKYHLWMKFNDTYFEIDTDNLFEAIRSFAPKSLKTKILFRVANNNGEFCERQVFVQRGKMLFRNDVFLRTFIRFLVYKKING